jgi:hypothetical protein
MIAKKLICSIEQRGTAQGEVETAVRLSCRGPDSRKPRKPKTSKPHHAFGANSVSASERPSWPPRSTDSGAHRGRGPPVPRPRSRS